MNNIRSKFRYRSNILVLGLIFIGLMVIFSFGTGNVSAAGNTVYVNASGGSDSYDGLSPVHTTGTTGPKATIKNGFATITTNGTLYIANGIYTETKDVPIETDMTVKGQSKTGTIIKGDSKTWIFNTVFGENVIINDLTICNGNTDGAAIENDGTLTVNNCVFKNNNATKGGAIQNDEQGILTVTGSTFTQNTAVNGSAIYNMGSMTVKNCDFTGNTATYNGAIYNKASLPVTVTGCTFTDNTAICGGAIYNPGSLTVNNSDFTGNTANYGGAIYNPGSLTLNKNDFTGNIATAADGGAIYNSANLVVAVTGCKFNDNNAKIDGGAIYNDDYTVLTVTDSSFTSNTANSGGAIFNLGTLNMHINRCIGNTAVNGNAICNGGTSDVANNWWGSNNGPSNGDVIGKTVLSWLVLKLNANPAIIGNNGHSIVTADLRYNNYGLIPIGSSVNGIPVKFSTTLGTISQASTVNGIAQSTLKSGTKAGTAIISASLDNQILQSSVKIKDTIPPKLISTNPKNGAAGISRTLATTIKFSENIKAGSSINNIKVKNLSTGKYITINKTIKGNTLTIKTANKTKNTWYQVIIPKAAIKDMAGNNLQTAFSFKFKTKK